MKDNNDDGYSSIWPGEQKRGIQLPDPSLIISEYTNHAIGCKQGLNDATPFILSINTTL